MTVKKTSRASVAVMMMWLDIVKAYGISPTMLEIRMKMNSENTSGKNFMPSSPTLLRTMLATNS